MLRRIVLLIGLLLSTAPLFAQNATTIGTLDLKATLDNISVKASYTGDANVNNSAVVSFRCTNGKVVPTCTSGTGALVNAYTPYNDRRALMDAVANPNYRQFRVSIVGLSSNVSYDVQVKFSDNVDGVSGGSACLDSGNTCLTGTITTYTLGAPYVNTGGGTVRSVTDDSSFNTALAAAVGGDTIQIQANTTLTAGKSISKSGSAAHWILINCVDPVTSRIAGTGNTNFTISGSFIVFQGCNLTASDHKALTISGGNNNIVVQNNTIQNVGVLCSGDTADGDDTDIGINSAGTVDHLWIVNNTIQTSTMNIAPCVYTGMSTANGNGASTGNDGHRIGVGIWISSGTTTASIKNNTVTGVAPGAFGDAITSDDTGNQIENLDCIGNTLAKWVDDGCEIKGTDINVRVESNALTVNTSSGSCIAVNNNATSGTSPGTSIGPVYVFRNTCVISSTVLGEVFKLGNSNGGTEGSPTYVFHNSINNTVSQSADTYSCQGGQPQLWIFNNIVKSTSSVYGGCKSPPPSDGNVVGAFLASNNDYTSSSSLWSYSGTINASSLANFQSLYGLEANSITSDPSFTSSSNLNLQTGSLAIDAGVVLNNFNDANSSWPLSGTKPDIGAFEFNSGGSPLTPGNSGTITVSNLSFTTLTLNWTAATGGTGTLLYEVCQSTTAITTIAGCEANLIQTFTAGISSLNVTGLMSSHTYFFNVVVEDSTTPTPNKALYTDKGVLTLDNTFPNPGNGDPRITVTNITTTTLTLSWILATDSDDDQTTLQYEVCQSASAITSIAACEANIVQAFTTNISTINRSGLTINTTYHFNVVVKDAFGNPSIYMDVMATTADTTPPSCNAACGITAANVTSQGLTLNWTKATDPDDVQAVLSYEVCQSLSNNVTSAAQCEAATIIQAFTANINTLAVTQLLRNGTYFFNVVVKDVSGNKTPYTPVQQMTLDSYGANRFTMRRH